ncbi:Bax inhibitor-1/YccA family protein [Natronosporangium hydrolyticum]|uniref:Bax inhibitor-1/YccA family protein n=1 Tax=Natronosporangium hydrolyticum TaxID=2811111 RepID=A0A895YFA4_9ACTN|nr:Bax inhibitor-1/YccA family protein [Natronosporangium hydrolyticum]QSB14119.1 Bax inhibitor-1/YccA family protein [Natronosporangium hydrolyticum]
MRTSNPVLTRLAKDAERERTAAPGGHQPQVFGQSAGAYPTGPDGTATAPPDTRPMTIDDVVTRTVGLIALVAVAAGVIWLGTEPADGLVFAFPAMIVGLVLGLIIAFARVTNPILISVYAAVMGVFLGAISQYFNAMYEGIVLQAVAATVGVFLLMGILYKSGTIRATPKFIKFMTAALVGAAAVILVNLGITLFTGEPTILRDGGPIAIIVSLVFIVLAALSFILSFHEVEEGVRLGLPQKYAWACAFGIVVSLIWLYIEVLRLLSYFQGD